MYKRMMKMCVIALASISMLAGCATPSTQTNQTVVSTEVTTEAATQETQKESQTEETTTVHSHIYTEQITLEAGCETEGEKTFTCECGDSYIEAIAPTGHRYGEYAYNDDATYQADGTETAICVCGMADTRTVTGTKLVPEPPIPMPDEQQTTVSQPETTAVQTAPPVADSAQGEVCPYELYVIYYDNQGYPYYYGKWGGSANMDAENYAKTEACDDAISEYLSENFTVWNEDRTSGSFSSSTSWQLIGTYQGMPVVVRYVCWLNDVRLSTPEERGIPAAGNGIK